MASTAMLYRGSVTVTGKRTAARLRQKVRFLVFRFLHQTMQNLPEPGRNTRMAAAKPGIGAGWSFEACPYRSCNQTTRCGCPVVCGRILSDHQDPKDRLQHRQRQCHRHFDIAVSVAAHHQVGECMGPAHVCASTIDKLSALASR